MRNRVIIQQIEQHKQSGVRIHMFQATWLHLKQTQVELLKSDQIQKQEWSVTFNTNADQKWSAHLYKS